MKPLLIALWWVGSGLLAHGQTTAAAPQAPSVRFHPEKRAVGDVMPYYHKGEYHVFYLLNAAGNHEINWEHVVSKDLVHWKTLPPAIRYDPADKTGPEGGCMFTGSIIEHKGVFHAFYTSWNRQNPDGREFICHATSKDLIDWKKHPEDMIAPDGIHYANHQARDFRDPHVVWDDERREFVMYINANKPGEKGFVYGVLTSPDLKRWRQQPAIEGIAGDECPDFFKSGDTYYLHGCNIYAFATHKDGPWRYPANNKVDRRMAAKRVFDGKRHVWFGGWLRGPMSVPREIYEGPGGTLYIKPVQEVVDVFSKVYLSQRDLALAAGKTWRNAAPRDYLLEATFDASAGRDILLQVRDPGQKDAHRLVLSPGKSTIVATGGQKTESSAMVFDATRPIFLQAFIIGGVAEVFVNSQYAATFMINPTGESLGIETEGGVVFRTLQIRVPAP